jgi:hypothetical protein
LIIDDWSPGYDGDDCSDGDKDDDDGDSEDWVMMRMTKVIMMMMI